MTDSQIASHTDAETPSVTTQEFAKRLGVTPWTVRNGRDPWGEPYSAHAAQAFEAGRACLRWRESYVARCVAERSKVIPGQIDGKQAAKILGCHRKSLSAMGLTAPYNIVDVLQMGIDDGRFNERQVLAYLQLGEGTRTWGFKSREQLAVLVELGVLPPFDELSYGGLWVWRLKTAGRQLQDFAAVPSAFIFRPRDRQRVKDGGPSPAMDQLLGREKELQAVKNAAYERTAERHRAKAAKLAAQEAKEKAQREEFERYMREVRRGAAIRKALEARERSKQEMVILRGRLAECDETDAREENQNDIAVTRQHLQTARVAYRQASNELRELMTEAEWLAAVSPASTS